jgi:hypothetical protein
MTGIGMNRRKDVGAGVKKRDVGGIVTMNIGAASISGCKKPYSIIGPQVQ